jgi:hypothetical protein
VQIRVDSSGDVKVVETADFTGLSVRTELDPARTSLALAGAGLLRDVDGSARSHVWLDIEALARRTGIIDDPEWRRGYGEMIGYAADQGWVDEKGLAVRAHIEAPV